MQSRPTIALISVHSDPATETGSQNVYVRQLGEALSRLGWQVDMFTRKTDASQSDMVQHNPNCRTIRLSAGVEQFVPRQKLIGYLPEFLKQLRQFQLANNIQYSLIHTNYWLSAWVGMELKKIQPLKHVHTFHSLSAVRYAKIDHLSHIAKIRLAIEKACLERADLTIATCPQQREYLRKLVSTKGNIEIVPCGTDTHIFGSVASITAKGKLDIESGVFNLLYAGRFARPQGIETLVRAVHKLYLSGIPNIHLTLVSSSHRHVSNQLERKRIKKLIEDLGIKNITTFAERISREELAMYYAAADVCVVPSYYNPSGMVALEAMASGTPVVASNVDGLKYVVEHEQTGLLFPPKNTTVLTETIHRLIADPKLRWKLGVSARERVEDLFTWDGVANQLSDFYQELIEAHNLELLKQNLELELLNRSLKNSIGGKTNEVVS
ncbi:Glycosyl transferase group 1 [Hyella patelloides LEGE 07179]|uniref:Glycosyl transferase group 1 n=1 Tax=Hyella patelloides LEGE 07179 TaxID=945734 RepID=A0A563VJ33_9CYAN|nr:glycosyltransferase [Hyella patelloides]VEP11422.1 Glycosyl transferase group 1 [Hyella patelloides LEGE 07179]